MNSKVIIVLALALASALVVVEASDCSQHSPKTCQSCCGDNPVKGYLPCACAVPSGETKTDESAEGVAKTDSVESTGQTGNTETTGQAGDEEGAEQTRSKGRAGRGWWWSDDGHDIYQGWDGVYGYHYEVAPESSW